MSDTFVAGVVTGIASIPPDGLTWREWFAAMRALNPDADGFRVPACFVVDDEPAVVSVPAVWGEHTTALPFVIDLDD